MGLCASTPARNGSDDPQPVTTDNDNQNQPPNPNWTLCEQSYKDTGCKRYKDEATGQYWVKHIDGTWNCMNQDGKIILNAVSSTITTATKNPIPTTPHFEKGKGKQRTITPPKMSKIAQWELLRGKSSSIPEELIFVASGMSLLSHENATILHTSKQPLTISFTCPPRVDAIVVLKYETKEGSWGICDGKCVQLKQRPLAEKLTILFAFPKEGKYKVELKIRDGKGKVEHTLACQYIVQVTNKSVVPEGTPTPSPKSSPIRHKSATSFRATSLTRVESAASVSGETLKKSSPQSPQEIKTRQLRFDQMYATEKIDTSLLKQFGVKTLSHETEQISYESNQPLIITLTSPPRVEFQVIMRHETELAAEVKRGWNKVDDGCVALQPRPMAHKLKMTIKFPKPGKYDVRLYGKEADQAVEYALIIKYTIIADQKTNANSRSPGGTNANSRSPGTRSPGMHLSHRKKIGSKGRRETKMSLW